MRTLRLFRTRGSQSNPEQTRQIAIALCFLLGLLIFFTWFIASHFAGYGD